MKYIAEYIWLDKDNILKSKSLTIDFFFENPEDSLNKVLDINIYNETSCNFINTNEIIILKPCVVFHDPFRKGLNVLVLCSVYNADNIPVENNYRDKNIEIFKGKSNLDALFILEQHFFITDNCPCCPNKDTNKPYNWGKSKINPVISDQYYCSLGSNNAFGRKIAEQAYHSCLEVGLKVISMNAYKLPGQWEIHIGPCNEIEIGDHCLLVKYILLRIGEIYNAQINLNPDLFFSNSSKCIVNFSTVNMRTNMQYIYEAFIRLCENEIDEKYHEKLDMIKNSDKNIDYNKIFKINTSIIIPFDTFKNKKGYIQDRRYRSNDNPYLITYQILKTFI